MANTRVETLFVLTLLQLCRAQNSNNISESWYLANLVNDEYQPKPITEIFSTPFSTANPIVVLPKSTPTSDKISSSTLSQSSFQTTETSSLPSSTAFNNVGAPRLSTITPQPEISSNFPSQTPQIEIIQFTKQINAPIQLLREVQKESQPTTESTSEPQLESLGTTVLEQVDFSQAPGFRGLQPTTKAFPSSVQTFQRSTTTPSILRTSKTGARTSQRPTQKPLTERPVTRNPPIDFQNSTQNNLNKTRFSGIGLLPLKIRVVGPRGSITNVHINPPVVGPPTTTTKRPTTTKTRKTPKPKRNTYEACINGCSKVKRKPICAIPLSATSIDADNLKGFPSVCHMACNNSYKKRAYEKFVDGRCGRLRTRIHTLDSANKLKREDLNKAQYSVENGNQVVSVQLSSLYD